LTLKTPKIPQNTQKRLKLQFLLLKNTKKASFDAPKHAKISKGNSHLSKTRENTKNATEKNTEKKQKK
jgi:hypothetical protein